MMKPFLAACLFLVACPDNAKPVTKVSGSEAKALVASGALLIDVRSPEEFADSHIDGARNIPLQDLTKSLGELSKDKPIVVYCAVGGRSAKAAGELASAGYRVHNLGAMAAWNNNN